MDDNHFWPVLVSYRKICVSTDIKRFKKAGRRHSVIIGYCKARKGRNDEAESALKQLLELVEDFETRGRHLIRTYVKVGEVVEMIVKGLQKAGLAGLG